MNTCAECGFDWDADPAPPFLPAIDVTAAELRAIPEARLRAPGPTRGIDEVVISTIASASRLDQILLHCDGSDWERAGRGSDGGRRTIGELAARAAHEIVHHHWDIAGGH